MTIYRHWCEREDNSEMFGISSLEVKGRNRGIKDCIDIVKQHSAWVSVSEYLPKPDTTVFAYDNFWRQDRRIITARMIDGEFLAYSGWHKTVNVTHWVELPQPPSEVQS